MTKKTVCYMNRLKFGFSLESSRRVSFAYTEKLQGKSSRESRSYTMLSPSSSLYMKITW